MALRHARDAAAAGWLASSGTPWARLISFGPAGFAAYARLRFIPDPTRPGQQEADVELPADHLSDLDQGRRALARLARHTRTPERCFFALWDGYPDLQLPVPPGERAAMVDLPHRRYALLEGPLDALATWESELAPASPLVPPAFVWPADRAWCFTSDVDPCWAGVGGSAEAVRDLLDDPLLDVVAADPRVVPPRYR